MASTSAKFGFIKGSPIIDVAELPNPVTKSAINPTGTISKVYFNTSLTAEEVNAFIDSVLGDVPSGTQKATLICCDGVLTEDGTAFNNSIGVAKMNTGTDNAYVISVYDNDSSVDCYMYMTAYGFNGWLDSSAGVLNNNPYTFSNPFTSVASVVTPDTQETQLVGEYNELLKDLIYVEEVDESKINTKALYRLPDGTLWHYNGQWNAVGSGGVEEGATAIDPLGTYDKFYFNTSLSVEEVDAMLSQLEYMEYDDIDTYGILVNSAFTQGILVMKGAFGETPFYIIAHQNQETNEMITIYSSASTGWQDESYSEFEFGSITGINEIGGTPIGHQNELLKNLISSTPFDNKTNFAILTKRINSLEARIKALEEA